VKDQYFGDVNDFFKYGLLRSLTIPDRLSLGVCWMLTEPDGGTNDKLLAYLDQPKKYRHCDPGLFDWLRQVVVVEEDRGTARIAESTLLGSALFKPGYVTDNKHQRSEYFSECASRFAGCDLIFFDPDNGLEIKSTPQGRKGSCKYLYWNEVCATFGAGSSVLIYQHFIREKRGAFITRMAAKLQRLTGAATIFSYRTPNVLFLLASQERYVAGFRRQLAALPSSWAPEQIIGVEHALLQKPGKGQPRVPSENRKRAQLPQEPQRLPPEPVKDWKGPVALRAIDTTNLWRTSKGGVVVNEWMDADRMVGYRLWVLFLEKDVDRSVLFEPFENQGRQLGGMKCAQNCQFWRDLVQEARRDSPVDFQILYGYQPAGN
jgi:hypothetical protein